MSNGRTNGKYSTIINYSISCPTELIDAPNHVKDVHLIFEFLDKVVVEVGVQNASNYVVDGKLLGEKHPTIFRTLCTTQYLDLMLEDIGKEPW